MSAPVAENNRFLQVNSQVEPNCDPVGESQVVGLRRTALLSTRAGLWTVKLVLVMPVPNDTANCLVPGQRRLSTTAGLRRLKRIRLNYS